MAKAKMYVYVVKCENCRERKHCKDAKLPNTAGCFKKIEKREKTVKEVESI
ncbi:MAG: hypothetical protein ACM3TR_09975 [Caulobacteraceae bacterium]